MAFVRSKKIKGISYLYRVETYRERGKVRQRVLGYLGRASPPLSKKEKKKVNHRKRKFH